MATGPRAGIKIISSEQKSALCSNSCPVVLSIISSGMTKKWAGKVRTRYKLY